MRVWGVFGIYIVRGFDGVNARGIVNDITEFQTATNLMALMRMLKFTV